MTASYGDAITIPSAADLGFSYEGYFINGWVYGNTSGSDGSVIIEELVLVDGYYSYYGSSYSVTEGYADWDMEAGVVFIAACWTSEDDACTITFNGNGSTDDSYTQVVDGSGYFYTPLIKNRFTREGYRFIGWTTTEEYDPNYLYTENILNPWSGSKITLYAQWEAL